MNRCQTVLVHWPNASLLHDVVEGFSTIYHPIHVYISILLCVFGVAANTIGIYILLKPSMRTPPNVVLVVMSFCNLALVLLFVAYTARRSFFADCTTASWSYGWALYLSVYGNLSVVSHASSVWLSVLLAVMRYVSLKLRKTQITTMQATILSAFVIFLVFALNLPNSLAYTVKEVPLDHVCFAEDESLRNATAYVAVISDVAKNSGCIMPATPSPIWQIDLFHKNNANEAECKLCPGKKYVVTATSNMIYHVQKHPEYLAKYQELVGEAKQKNTLDKNFVVATAGISAGLITLRYVVFTLVKGYVFGSLDSEWFETG